MDYNEQVEPSKIWFLNKVNLFEGLSEEDMGRIDDLTHMEKVPKGTYFFLPENPSDSIYFIKQEKVKIAKLSSEGKEATLAILEEGEIFGEMALVEEGPRKTVAEALEDTFICTMSKSNFEALIRMNPDLSVKITKLMGLRRLEIESRVDELIFCDVPTSLAHFLLRMEGDYGENHRLGSKIKLKITHQEIANLIGSTRETTTSVLNTFKKKGIIDFDRRYIIIKDIPALSGTGIDNQA